MLFLIFICFLSANAGPPVFNDNNDHFTAKENVILKVRCSASGDPEPTYRWQNEQGQEVGPHLNPPIWVESGEDKGSLLVFNVTFKEHSGLYTCVAKNSHGLRSKIFEINITLQEDEANVQVSNVTDRSVTFDLVPQGGNEVYDLKYTEKYQNTTYYFQYTGKDRTIKIINLIPSGQYSFIFSRKVKSGDEKGWTLNLTVVLLPAKPEVIFHSLKDGMVTFTWFRIFDDFMRKTIDKYHLTYRVVNQVGGRTWKYDTCFVSIDIPACAAAKYTLADLSRHQWYEINLSAHTAAGYGEAFKNKIFVS